MDFQQPTTTSDNIQAITVAEETAYDRYSARLPQSLGLHSKTANGICSPVSISTLTVAIPNCLVVGGSAPDAEIVILPVSWVVILSFWPAGWT